VLAGFAASIGGNGAPDLGLKQGSTQVSLAQQPTTTDGGSNGLSSALGGMSSALGTDASPASQAQASDGTAPLSLAPKPSRKPVPLNSSGVDPIFSSLNDVSTNPVDSSSPTV
jgi:hypothetical protein